MKSAGLKAPIFMICRTLSLAALLYAPQGFANRDAIPEKETVVAKEEGPILWLNPNSLDKIRIPLGFEVQRTKVIALMSDAENQKRKVRVAILDKGFANWEKRKGVTLPTNTRYFAGSLKTENLTPHGSLMGEMLTTMVAGPQWQKPKADMSKLPFDLYLINVAGFTNFREAIQTVIKEKIDIVLYSEVWELGGNWDGRGFINAEVNKALDAGVIWINASGNFHGRTYNGPVELDKYDMLKLPDEKGSLKVVCEPLKKGMGCMAKVTLAWNDFSDDWNVGTKKDLNLGVFNEDFETVQISRLKQVDIEGDAKGEQSKYSRESVAVELKKGTYYIRVKSAKKMEWTEKDKVRILVDGDGISMPSASKTESLQNPADNRRVITVGADDSDRTSISVSLRKPELMIRSSVTDSTGQEFRGSSNAAALVAGGAVLLKYQSSKIGRKEILSLMTGAAMRSEAEWGWEVYGMQPNNPCIPTTNIRTGIQGIDGLLSSGGRWIQTSYGPKIMVDYPVTQMRSDLSQYSGQQISVWMGQSGLSVTARGQWPNDQQAAEVIQRPRGTVLCDESWAPSLFQLPVQ